jgi:hypothetical protein
MAPPDEAVKLPDCTPLFSVVSLLLQLPLIPVITPFVTVYVQLEVVQLILGEFGCPGFSASWLKVKPVWLLEPLWSRFPPLLYKLQLVPLTMK